MGKTKKRFSRGKRNSQIDRAKKKKEKSGDIKADAPFDTMENGSGKVI